MKESSKTSIFLAVAFFLAIIAYWFQPAAINDSPDAMVGKVLFEKLAEDPLAIKSLEITKVDPVSGDLSKFQVAEVNGRWTIPSHEAYPSDAKDQMAQVAAALTGLEVLSVASADGPEKTDANPETVGADIQRMYGVADPTSNTAGTGSGAGIKITCLGPDEKELANLIIGNEVEGSPGLRYIRIPNQHPVYTARISTDKMSTRFEDWIEKNLLNISSFDIQKVSIEDYSIDVVDDEGERKYRASLELKYDDRAAAGKRWTLESLALNQGNRTVPNVPLGGNEEIAEDKLAEMITSLDDLKIVDVRRKPEFLATPLRESRKLDLKLLEEDGKIFSALQQRGFYFAMAEPADGGEPVVGLYSSSGEVIVAMKNGVRYFLRFGRLAGMGADVPLESTNPDDPDSGAIAMNRFLFVMTDFDENLVAKPTLEELPEIPTEGEESVIEEAKKKREDIEKSNARLMDQYNGQLESGKKASAELNKRFSDWYYIISEDVFKKVRLGYDNIIQPKSSESDDPDSSMNYGDFDLGSEFPEINEHKGETLPGQEGAFPAIVPANEPENQPEPMNEPESENEPESINEPEPENQPEPENE